MVISADQRAVLQLLLERGQSYSAIAGVLGGGEDDVRARARAALAELGGADPDRNVALTDYLLGQADPIGRADASRHLRENVADRELAGTLSERLRELFPAATLPKLPGEQRPGRLRARVEAARPRSPRRERPPERSGLSTSQTRLIVGLGSAAVLLIVIVLAITGAFGGGEDEATTTTPTTEATASTPTEGGDEQLQRVALSSPGGGDAEGEAVFGLATGDQPFVELSLNGLDPAPQDQTYVVWLMLTPDQGYPLSPITATQQGTFDDRFPIPSAVLPVVARVRFVEVAIAPVGEVRRTVREAIESTSLVLDRPGRTVLRGEIPRAQRQPQGETEGG